MVASPSKKKKGIITTVEDISRIIDNFPTAPMYRNDDTGEYFQLGQVISTPFNPTNFTYDGSSVGTKLNGLYEIAQDIVDDDRYQVDFELRADEDNKDYLFLLQQIQRHGERV